MLTCGTRELKNPPIGGKEYSVMLNVVYRKVKPDAVFVVTLVEEERDAAPTSGPALRGQGPPSDDAAEESHW